MDQSIIPFYCLALKTVLAHSNVGISYPNDTANFEGWMSKESTCLAHLSKDQGNRREDAPLKPITRLTCGVTP